MFGGIDKKQKSQQNKLKKNVYVRATKRKLSHKKNSKHHIFYIIVKYKLSTIYL
jgi:hypothetical protein